METKKSDAKILRGAHKDARAFDGMPYGDGKQKPNRSICFDPEVANLMELHRERLGTDRSDYVNRCVAFVVGLRKHPELFDPETKPTDKERKRVVAEMKAIRESWKGKTIAEVAGKAKIKPKQGPEGSKPVPATGGA